MKGIVIFFILFLFVMILAVRGDSEAEQRRKKEYSDKDIELIKRYEMECLGGFKDIGACKQCTVEVFSDRIWIRLVKRASNGMRLGDKFVEVMINDIVDISLQTESQITEQISLGKVLIFGFASLGMKKNKKRLIQEYVVMTIKHENEKVSLILCSNINSSLGEQKQFEVIKQINSLRNVAMQENCI